MTLLPYITDVTPLNEDAVRVHYSVQPNIVDLLSSFTLRYVLPPPNTGTYAVVQEPSSNQSDFTVEDIEPSFTYQFELVTEIGLFTYYSEVYSYNSTGMCVCVHVCVCVHACVCACTCVRVCVRVCVCV